ncbi:hypothetical protein H4217_004299 [Coemansia sp. RSA 1939]|nr:hypothetical protein H4217_004299 [Coemansia sp. RSA 1939]KAJ2605963.1 hypothetical protein EV177_006030 [Coemansia sp. RSA 1804]KAJ2681263.1 hypothetical protein GGH99_005303 [Coemansia sp. RSA 1285]
MSLPTDESSAQYAPRPGSSEHKTDDALTKWRVSALYTYPVKSCQPAVLQESSITETGLAYDRLWVLTDKRLGRFVTQRQVPKLVLVKVTIDEASNVLELSADAMATTLRLPLHPQPEKDLGERFKVRIWYEDAYGRCCGEHANSWLSEFTGKPIRLLYKDADTQRLVSRYVPSKEVCPTAPQSGFADLFPFHITTDVSLNDVNKHLTRPLTHKTFRPNIVLTTDSPIVPPYDEETWRRIEFIGDNTSNADMNWSMFITSRTPRCSMLNVDMDTGTMVPDREPYVSLLEFRCVDAGQPKFSCFGMQATPQTVGQNIRVGQEMYVRERGVHLLTEPL